MAVALRFRLSMATTLMLVAASASASALFARVRKLITSNQAGIESWRFDVPTLLVLAIALTALALGASKRHAAGHILFQATLAYLGFLSVIGLAEAEWTRGLLYWYQTAFLLTVALPLVARRFAKDALPRGPRRDWWKDSMESCVFAFVNMHLVLTGIVIQLVAAQVVGSFN